MDSSWNGGPVGELTATKFQKPSQNFVEGIFDALTSYMRFLLTSFRHTLHLAFIIYLYIYIYHIYCEKWLIIATYPQGACTSALDEIIVSSLNHSGCPSVQDKWFQCCQTGSGAGDLAPKKLERAEAEC